MDIQWYPGHMAKARRMIGENMKLVDAVCEVVDARIPNSSRNPDFDELLRGKARLLILNRVDQADPTATKKWSSAFRSNGTHVLETDSRSGRGVGGLSDAVSSLLSDKIARYAAKNQAGRQLRAMVVGIPNVGKSSFINRAANRKAAATSDRPGVTRGKQWICIDSKLELLDTPGVLWPKLADRDAAENLAFTGAIKDETLDADALGERLMQKLWELYPGNVAARYGITESAASDGYGLLLAAAKNRGFLIHGGEYDVGRMAIILLDEFRAGKLGRITLENCGDV